MTTTQYIKVEDLEEGESFRFEDDEQIYVLVRTDWNPNSVQPLVLHWKFPNETVTGRTNHNPEEIVELI